MKGFAVIDRARDTDIKYKFPMLGRVYGMKNLILPYRDEEIELKDAKVGKINISSGFENGKLKMAYKMGIKEYGYVVSKTYGINYNPFFYHSCLIRGLDFFTVKLGCDMRFNEVAIADASSLEGRNAFRLLLPIARRIVLVTDNKSELEDEVKYAIMRYGTSVGLIEDPVKAADSADVIIISSKNENHRYLIETEKPTLFFKYLYKPKTKMWFDNLSISFNNHDDMDVTYAQGYIDIYGKTPVWYNAEKEGFKIFMLKKENFEMLRM